MSTAFKEWAVVCEALGGGKQSVIVRKGGIAEGRAGFSFNKQEFFLFPTWFHEQLAKTRLPAETEIPPEAGEELEIRYAAAIEWSGMVEDWEKVRALEELHVLNEDTVKERFHYDDKQGLHVAFVRVYRLEPPQKLHNEKKYGGCRSWIEVPDFEGSALVSVISDEEHLSRKQRICTVLGLTF